MPNGSIAGEIVELVRFRATVVNGVVPVQTRWHGSNVTHIGLGLYQIDLGLVNQIDDTQRTVTVTSAVTPPNVATLAFEVRGAQTDRLIQVGNTNLAGEFVDGTLADITVLVARSRN